MSSRLSVILAAGVLAGMAASASAQDKPHFGKPISEADIAPWNIDIRTPDGKGLPPGSGNVADGEKIYNVKCLACHGPKAAGGAVYGTMVGGIGFFKTEKRVLTPGSMYPVRADSVRLHQPRDADGQAANADAERGLRVVGVHPESQWPDPGRRGDGCEYAAESEDAQRRQLLVDDRPDTKAVRCMSNCR